MNSAISRLIDNISCPDILVPRENRAAASSKLDRWKVDNPTVPFRQTLVLPLIPRAVLVISGVIPKHAKRFHINFIIDSAKGINIAFHLNPRFDEGCLVANSLFNEKWEEQITEKPNPIKKGAGFSLEIFVTSEEYLVSVDRNHVLKFGHRIALNEVNRIDIVGDVQILTAELTMKDFYPPSAVSNNIYIHDKLKVPYNRAFIDNVVPSTIVNIRGVVPEKAVRFSINFCTDWSGNSDIAFHFNPRFDQQFVACNSYHGGKWATELVEGYGKHLFTRGHAFFIDIYTTHSYFVVYLNGVHFCKFQYRISLNRIKRLEVIGDVVLKWVNVMSNSSPDEFEIVESNCVVFDNVVVPFCRAFLDPLSPKTDILIFGTVDKEAIRFVVNLCLDPLKGGDIALHFNPRFDQNYVARNSRLGDHWGQEEAHAFRSNPFSRGSTFVLEFFVTRTEFLISVNGSHFCSYKHRVSFMEIQQIEIDGDISLSRVELTNKECYPSTFGLVDSAVRPSQSLSCPVTYKLRGDESLACGRAIEITGRVKLLPVAGFHVNLQKGNLFWPHPQVGFHLSVRFGESAHQGDTCANEHCVILNTWKDTGWGPEVSTPLCSTLGPGSEFTLVVRCTDGSFDPEINNRAVGRLEYKMELKPLDTLYIQGDILVGAIRVV